VVQTEEPLNHKGDHHRFAQPEYKRSSMIATNWKKKIRSQRRLLQHTTLRRWRYKYGQ
jgi:hypothetical protein